jgi:hypothetical protein
MRGVSDRGPPISKHQLDDQVAVAGEPEDASLLMRVVFSDVTDSGEGEYFPGDADRVMIRLSFSHSLRPFG